MRKFYLLLSFLSLIGVYASQAQSIATARAAAINSVVTIRGIVTNGSELGAIRYVQDSTSGISIYGSNLANIQRGDSILATGTLTSYNNLLEITPVTTITVLASGQTIPTPVVINNTASLNDSLEGQLVRISSCTFPNGGANFGSNVNYTLTTANNQTFVARIVAGNPLVGTLVPSGPISLTGILSQFCASPATGCTTGYQVIIRNAADLQSVLSISMVTAPKTTLIDTATLNINWNTNVAGTNSWVQYGRTPNLELGNVTATNGTTHTVSLSGLTPATIYYVKAFSVNGTDTTRSLVKVFCTRSKSSGDIKTYFNRFVDLSVSSGTPAVQLNNLIADTLAAYIGRAKYTLDIAIYNWDASVYGNKIVNAVNAAVNRGVKVRIIYDGSSSNAALTSLNSSVKKVASPQGASYTIMHNKFVVIDENSSDPNDPIVWTGSTNWTASMLNTDANNVVIVQDQSLARGYRLEFNEMWGDTSQTAAPNTSVAKFGQFKTDNTPHEYVIGGRRVESYFSPSDQTNSAILSTIATANSDLYFAQFVMTRSDNANGIKSIINTNSIANAKGLFDDSSSSSNCYLILKPALSTNVDVFKHSYILHHKYLIVDQSNPASDPLVLTGSHNWSNAGDQKNDENTLVIHDASIANQFFQEFMGRWCERNAQVCNVTGVQNVEAVSELVLYPNPNNGRFTLAFQANADQNMQYRILDMTGRAVMQSQHRIQAGNNRIELGQESLAKGLYWIQIQTQGGSFSRCFSVE